MRVRIDELLKERGWTVYQLAKAVEDLGVVSEQAVYRLARARGRVKRMDVALLGALCEVFDIGPGELLERDPPSRRKRRR